MSHNKDNVLNPGSSFSIATLVCGSSMVLLAGFATYNKRQIGLRGPAQKDIAGLVSMIILIIAGTTCSVLQARAGLGYAASFSSDAQRRVFQKAEYLGQLVFVVATFVSKLRYLFVLPRIGPSQKKALNLEICLVVIILAAISFVAATIFQCSHPLWNLHSQKCIHRPIFWTAFCSFDITGEILTVFLFLRIVLRLQMNPQHQKDACSKACVFKGLLIASAVARLCYVWRSADDSTYLVTSLPIVICSQVQIYLITLDWIFTALSFLVQHPSGYMSSAMVPMEPNVNNISSPGHVTSESLEDLVPPLHGLGQSKVRCGASMTANDEGEMDDSGRIMKIVEFEVTSVRMNGGPAEIRKLAAE